MLADSVGRDYALLVLAALLCAGGGFAAFTIYAHLLARGNVRHQGWLLLNGLCAGGAIWAALFLILLAHNPGLPAGYDALLSMTSLAVAVVGAIVGLRIAMLPRREAILTGGTVIGIAIAAAQLLLMRAVTVPAAKEWSAVLLGLAILFGPPLAAGAMLAYNELRGLRARLAATGLLTLATLAVGVIGMSALSFTPEPGILPAAEEARNPVLALGVAGIAALVLFAGYIIALMDGQLMRVAFARIGELVDATMEGLVIAEDGVILSVNAKALELSGRMRDELIGRKVFGDLFNGNPLQFPPDMKAPLELPLLRADGTFIFVEVIRRPIHALAQGNEVFAFRDLRERQEAAKKLAKADEELRRSETELRMRNLILHDALANIPQGLCMFDANQRVVISNERYATMYGLGAEAIQPGMHLREIIEMRIERGIYAGESPAAYMAERLAPVVKPENTVHELRNGQIIAIGRRPLPGGGWVTTHEDITERRRIEERIEHLTRYDALTDLHSRSALRERLEENLAAASRNHRGVAVLIIGIDRFDEINDTMGHGAGETLLKSVAARLRNVTRRATVLGRFGEDEFLVIEIVDHPARDVGAMIGRIQEALSKPYALGASKVEVTSAIGIAVSPSDGTDAGTLLKNASLALHVAKTEAPGSHRFFEPAMDQELRDRLSLERDLGEALERGQFELQYQPLVSLSRNQVTGFEALLRWRHPLRGQLAPGDFVAVAERMGLMPAIGEWALRQACTEAQQWPSHLTVAVNVSETQFRSPDFVPMVVRTLAATGMTADRLEIEVTEKVMHGGAADAIDKLRELAALGVRIALDDFGSGFSSLTYLRQFAFHKIKIDRSFVASAAEQEDAKVIIRTLARLGMGMHITTTAEGVETKEQLDMVRAEGCTEMQGYYFSPPKTAEEIRRLFLSRPRDSAVA